ncbi:MAG: hypothetical protein HYV18_08935 [Gammaproteobacteria bacterium]|nr:hypothetical protein [Gammaproteobacteria bacterium]
MKRRVVITAYRPWMRWTLLTGGSALLALGAWALYAYTRATTVSDFERAQIERDQLMAERRELTRSLREARKEISDLKEQVVYLQRSQEIDKQACETVRSSLTHLQEEASDLQEQVAFYRGIVSPDSSRAGVRVYEFKVFGTSTPGVFRYELVLIQSVRHDRRIAGRIEVAVQGLQAGLPQSVRLTDVTLGNGQNLLFSFKYFEEFAGEFRLPDGFRPTRVSVAVVPEGSGLPRVEDEYEWSKIQGG